VRFPTAALFSITYAQEKGESGPDGADLDAHNERECTGDGKVITHIGLHVNPASRKPTKLRTLDTIVDKDHFNLEWFAVEGDGEEMLGVSLKHTRRKE
jgi:hypothetical protein